jgi:DNA topoisomerase I
MPRLRRVDNSQPGYTRRRRGKGFSYLDSSGRPLRDEDELARIAALVLPPAWTDVWICPHANGHIQATGYDVKGRRQYRYHDAWRTRRDQQKFDHMQTFGLTLPTMREQVALDMQGGELDRTRVLACAVRLLDLGFFRIGGEDYAAENDTYGLATMRKDHVSLHSNNELIFDYTAKSGKHRVQAVVDPEVYDVVAALKRRRSGGPELLSHRSGKSWKDVKSADINQYVKSMTGDTFSAKDFRTWNATVLAAVALGVSEQAANSPTARTRAIRRAVVEVSEYLGNTPAVARSSYIDPRVIDRFLHGETIGYALDRLGVDTPTGHPATQGAVELAVLELLQNSRS